jgi:hypothetical protein
MRGDWKWYITIAAVRQYMAIAGLSGDLEDSNPNFLRAQEELGDLSLTAKPVIGKDTDSGAVIYRGKVTINGKRRRIECTVMPIPRTEGKLPQLLRVTLK